MAKIVGVAVDKIKYHFDFLYSYRIPNNLDDHELLGARVVVPFGRSNSPRQGIIFTIDDSENNFDIDKNIKDIYLVMDKEPMLNNYMLNLAKYIKNNYYCTLFEAIKIMLPPVGKLSLHPILTVDQDIYLKEYNKLSPKEHKLVKYVMELKNSKMNNFKQEDLVGLQNLKNFGIVDIKYKLSKNLKEKLCLPLILSKSHQTKERLTEKQKTVVNFIGNCGASTSKEICYFTGISSSVINNLVKKGTLEHINPQKDVNTFIKKKSEEINLTDLQKKVFSELMEINNQKEYKISFIYGVTGSGKTMVMMSLIDQVLKEGKSVIFMVPEIVLTAQLVLLFKSRYGEGVAVLHSGLPNRERENEWKRIKSDEAKVVVGTRTAAFAPTSNLGLIIMDEEHECTYKSECSPRFHARDIAKFRCKQNKCMLLLGSATPSVESYFLAKSGIYSLHKMDKRYGKACLPDTEIIDMNVELMKGNPTPFSKRLVDALNEEISQGKQAILLMNRRGYNTFVRCRECKEMITCPNCNITLNYHKDNNRLMCHYCGYSAGILKECPKCHGFNIEYNGIGTQRAEFQLGQIMPNAKILRIDSDSMVSKDLKDGAFDLFFKKKYDIMIGTQMISKGLNFSNVTLVGVLSADQALYSDDFRSYERAFSLITQVVGRSGRGDAKGKALIQTYTPENSIIGLAAKQDYISFYDGEIKIRKEMLYPPFVDICVIGFTGNKEKTVLDSCRNFFEDFKAFVQKEYGDIPLRIFRPSAANVNKVCGSYRFRMVIKCKNNSRFREMMSKVMMIYEKDLSNKGVGFFIDMNPQFIL